MEDEGEGFQEVGEEERGGVGRVFTTGDLEGSCQLHIMLEAGYMFGVRE